MKVFDAGEYLARIGFIPRKEEDLTQRLRRLHRCHSLTVPFECLDPFCAVPVSLAVDEVFEKVVRRHRGGYCFELNLLFFHLLQQMEYPVKRLLCRPFSGEGVKLPLTHRLTAVAIGETVWLADVGLGGNGWIEPLAFRLNEEQVQRGRVYRIVPEPDMGYVVQIKRGHGFADAVAFGFQYAEESDFEMANYYTCAHPSSPFVNRMMCTLPTSDGRYTIRDTKFKIEREGRLTEHELGRRTVDGVLERYFGIELTEPMRRRIHAYLEESGAK